MAKKDNRKLYVVKKYVMARSAKEALKLEKKQASDDVWVDEEWKKTTEPYTKVTGFQ